MREKLTLSLTGHRPKELWGYDLTKSEYLKLQEHLEGIISGALTKANLIECHTGMALGADTVWAKAIVNMKSKNPDRIKFIADIPFPDQPKAWPKTSQEIYYELVAQSDEQVYYAETYVPQCMQQRNIGMVDPADFLIAVWNGVIKKGSGTSNAIVYAKGKGKKIIVTPLDLGEPFLYEYNKEGLLGLI